jgi:hypothetical protein
MEGGVQFLKGGPIQGVQFIRTVDANPSDIVFQFNQQVSVSHEEGIRWLELKLWVGGRSVHGHYWQNSR